MRRIPGNYRILAAEWDAGRSMPVATPDVGRGEELRAVMAALRSDRERLQRIVHRLDDSCRAYTADDVADAYRRFTAEFGAFAFMERLISSLRARGKTRTAETYRAALKSFRRFRRGCDIVLDALDADTVEAYEAHLRARGNSRNTTSFYMRILRAAYRRAAEQGGFPDARPFRRVYTGVEKTAKRAIPLDVLRRIRALDLSAMPAADYARDMFILSFCLRGMSFIDMAFLRRSDLSDGHVEYRRRKTGRLLRIEWTAEMQAIVDKYPPAPEPYLLPVIPAGCPDRYAAYRNRAAVINHHLKRVGRMAGAAVPLTLYCARHSWASAANAKGVPLAVICEGMGHDSQKTTQIYLSGLATSLIDEANSLILRSL